jgi:hypothetical protein
MRREKLMMRVVHFTEGATDPLHGFRAHGVRFVPLADGAGDDETYVSCLHFEPGGWISDPPATRDAALLVVQGAVIVVGRKPTMRADLSPGVGIVVDADARYRVESDGGAVVMLVEAERLEATDLGMSSPERIWGQVWPGERLKLGRRTVLGRVRSMYWRWRWRASVAQPRLGRADSSGGVTAAEAGESAEGMGSGRRRDATRR